MDAVKHVCTFNLSRDLHFVINLNKNTGFSNVPEEM